MARKRSPKHESWWGAVWRGLVVDPEAKHYHAVRSSLWLFLYLIIHANRKTGVLFRKQATIAFDMGVNVRTVRHWLSLLRKSGYVTVKNSGRFLTLAIHNWKPLINKADKLLPDRSVQPVHPD
jgi:hypothetical protein